MNQVLDQFQIGTTFGRNHQNLCLQQLVQPQQRRIAAQLVAHQCIGCLGAVVVEFGAKHRVEQIKRRMAFQPAAQQLYPLLHATQLDMRHHQLFGCQRQIHRALLLEAFPGIDRGLVGAGLGGQITLQ